MKKKLGELCKVVSGTTPKTGIPEYWSGSAKWITPAELDDDSYIVEDSARKITELGIQKTGLSPFPAGTVLLTSRAPIGKVAIAGCEMYCNQGFKNLVCSEKIHNKFLYWFLKSKTAYLNSLGRGATFKEISKAIVEQIEIELPSLEKQKAVARVLEKIRHILHLRRAQLTALDELVKARFVEMFGDPVGNPMGWQRVRFDSLCENLDSYRIPITSSNRKTGIYPYYGASGIVDYVEGFIFDEDILLISEDGANLVARTTPIAFSVSGKVWVNNHAHVVRFKEIATQKYIEIAFSLTDISEHITGTAQPKLNQAKLNAMLFCNPPLHLQKQFFDFVSRVDNTRATIQRSLAETQRLFDSQLQEHFG